MGQRCYYQTAKRGTMNSFRKIRKLWISGLVLFVFYVGCDEKTETIHSIDTPANNNSMQPYLFAHGKTLYMSWTEKFQDSQAALYVSKYENAKWSDKVELDRGQDWFVNWADFPSISKSGNSVISHYLKKSDTATFAYDIRYLYSSDQGESWSKSAKLHTDSTKTEHGFVSFSPVDTGSFQVAWLDGRNTSTTGGHDSHGGSGAMQLRSAKLNSKGQLVDEQLVDKRTCDCCQTSIVTTEAGSLIAYRDRSPSEVRDIYVSLLKDGKWSEPRPVYNDHWTINGCPVNGPKLSAYKNKVCVAWFSAASDQPEVKLAFSDDGGLNFDNPVRIDEGRPIGRVDVVLIDEKRAVVSWMESTDVDAELRCALVDREQGIISSFKVSDVSGSRATGFPQLEMVAGDLYFAWNQSSDESQKIKMVRVQLHDFELR